jgi:hypothetical protein
MLTMALSMTGLLFGEGGIPRIGTPRFASKIIVLVAAGSMETMASPLGAGASIMGQVLEPPPAGHVPARAPRRYAHAQPTLSGAGAAVESIRTLALVGPAAAGKTSLAEAMLVASGAIVTPGSLERGTTVSDFDALERRMQHSLNSSVLHLERAAPASTSSTRPAPPISSARACPRSRRWRPPRWSSAR